VLLQTKNLFEKMSEIRQVAPASFFDSRGVGDHRRTDSDAEIHCLAGITYSHKVQFFNLMASGHDFHCP